MSMESKTMERASSVAAQVRTARVTPDREAGQTSGQARGILLVSRRFSPDLLVDERLR